MEHRTPAPLPEGYVDFFKDLESWQNEQTIRLRKQFNHVRQDLNARLLEKKQPLLAQINPHIEGDLLKQSLQSLLDFLEVQRPTVKPAVDGLRANLDKLDYDLIIKAFLKPREADLLAMAEKSQTAAEFFIFSIDNALRPVLRLIAESYQSDLAAEDFQWIIPNQCPICGAKSHFSRLRQEDGQRIMFCDRCFSEWKTHYLYCVHCGNDYPNDINYISVEGDDAYRAYICKKCQGYLKTYDERSAGKSVDLYIANIETIYLDLLAQEKGYTNHDND